MHNITRSCPHKHFLLTPYPDRRAARWRLKAWLSLFTSLSVLPGSLMAQEPVSTEISGDYCVPSESGNPCNSQDEGPSLNLGAGNPVNLATGNKFQREDDLPLRSSGLEWQRYYNSALITEQLARSQSIQPFGPGWRHSYSRHLYISAQPVATGHKTTYHYQAFILDDDGTRIDFQDFSSTQTSSQSVDGTSQLQFDLSGQWIWSEAKGIKHIFNRAGELVAYEHPLWPRLEFSYEQGLDGVRDGHQTRHLSHEELQALASQRRLAAIHSADGERLELSYQLIAKQLRLVSVQSPVGQFSYQYDFLSPVLNHKPLGPIEPRLIRVQNPQQWQFLYRYQVPTYAEKDRIKPLITGLDPQKEASQTRQHAPYDPYLLSAIAHQAPGQKHPSITNLWRYDSGSHYRAKVTQIMVLQPKNNLIYKADLDYSKTPLAPDDEGLTLIRSHYYYVPKFQDKQNSLPLEALEAATPFKSTTTQVQYRWLNHRYVLESVKGAACPVCPKPGTHASYNQRGQLTQWDDQYFSHDRFGRLQALSLPYGAWQRLALQFDANAYPEVWSTPSTASTWQRFTGPLLKRVNNADGYSQNFAYDKQGDIKSFSASASGAPPDFSAHLQKIDEATILLRDSVGSERFHFDQAKGRLTKTTIRFLQNALAKDGQAEAYTPSLKITESFRPDYANKQLRHDLPEGGYLLYEYEAAKAQTSALGQTARNRQALQLKQITWFNQRHQAQQLWRKGNNNFEYGNHLVLHSQKTHPASSVVRRVAPVYREHLELRQMQNPLAPSASSSESSIRSQRPYTVLHQEKRRYSVTGLLQEQRIEGQQSLAQLTVHRDFDYTPQGSLHSIHSDGPAVQGRRESYYQWDRDGQLLLRLNGDQSGLNVFENDTRFTQTGLALTTPKFDLHYNSRGLLESVTSRPASPTELRSPSVHYLYNALGLRTAKQQEARETQFFYVDQQLVAEASFNPATTESPRITRRYIYDGVTAIAMLDYTQNPEGEIFYIHNNMIGQPYMLSNAKQEIVWLAHLNAFGYADIRKASIDFNLRLPGQYFDAESGLHQNTYRYYDPQAGHYLQTDPLGPQLTTSPYGYADQRPLTRIDPLGLLLFVFDGTSNTPESESNPYKLMTLYNDGPVHYHAGPGTEEAIHPHYDADKADKLASSKREFDEYWINPPFKWYDSLVAITGSNILNAQWYELIQELSHLGKPDAKKTVPIDIFGFSRGAALSLAFSSRIADYTHKGLFTYESEWFPDQTIQACVNLRFMGLFDTVAQFAALGAHNYLYDLRVAPAWKSVAHAVALHEFRTTFPVTGLSQYKNVKEVPFIGSHSDIGGTLFDDDLNTTYQQLYAKKDQNSLVLSASSNLNNSDNWFRFTCKESLERPDGAKAQPCEKYSTMRNVSAERTHDDAQTSATIAKPSSDLGNIPLNWVYSQARLAGVNLKDLSSSAKWHLDTVQHPFAHLDWTKQLEEDFGEIYYDRNIETWNEGGSIPKSFLRDPVNALYNAAELIPPFHPYMVPRWTKAVSYYLRHYYYDRDVGRYVKLRTFKSKLQYKDKQLGKFERRNVSTFVKAFVPDNHFIGDKYMGLATATPVKMVEASVYVLRQVGVLSKSARALINAQDYVNYLEHKLHWKSGLKFTYNQGLDIH